MIVPIVLVIVLPIFCAVFGFCFGIATARWRNYLGQHETYSLPSVTNNSNEVACLEEITIQAPFSSSEATPIAAATLPLTATPSMEKQFNIGPSPPGLAQIRTPRRRRNNTDEILGSQQAETPINTLINKGKDDAATPYTTITRHGSPTAHLMGHLVRCASQAIDQMESRSVLQRLTSADATQFFAPSPFLFSPAAGAASGQQQDSQAFTTGADEIHMDEVDLISKLGGGSFGSVYRGAWRGAPVAVKYIKTRTDKADSLGSAIREVVLSKKLTHPNIVQTFSWTVLAQPPPQAAAAGGIGDEESEKKSEEGHASIAGVLDFSSRNSSDVSEIARLSSSLLLHRNGSIDEEEKQVEGRAEVIPRQEELYSIPAVWNNTTNNSSKSTTSTRPNNISQNKQQLKTTTTSFATDSIKIKSPVSSSSPCSPSINSNLNSRGVKRRRTGLDSATPSPKTLELDPRMDSFNSEEGFGSPIKKKHGGVQSIFNLESLELTETEALLVVVMEHCDLGSLQRALHRKAFLPSAKWPQHATFRALLRTAAEVAKGMEYIHGQHGVVHGDLKPANVLLKTHRADRRGYVAKVADFGLSWHVEENSENENNQSSNSTNNITAGSVGGTTAYLPPEAFENSACRGRPGDVYAFGIVLWSMYYCKAPYEGMMEAQVCAGVMNGWLRPEFTQDCPAAFRNLAERCWAHNAEDRPTFAQVWRELVDIEVEFRSQRLRSKNSMVNAVKRPASAPIKVE